MGGSKPQLIQTPVTAAPSAGESAAQIAEARLKYDPQMAAQEMALQQQFAPQQAALYQSMYGQYYPQMAKTQQELQQQLYPQQSQIMEAGAGKVLEQLQSPYGYTGSQQSALDAMRQRQREQLTRQLRERENLGGGLYSGRAAGREEKGLSELEQAFTVEDMNRQLQGLQVAQQAANPYLQVLYPQVGTTQPNLQNYQYNSAVASPDSIYNAMFQASQPNYMYQQGSPSPAWGMAGQIAGGALGGLMGNPLGFFGASSIRYKKNIKLYG